GIEAGGDASLDAADVRLRCGDVLLAREEEGYVHRHTREDRLLDGRDALRRAGDLDEEVRATGARMQVPRGGDGALRVVREIGGWAGGDRGRGSGPRGQARRGAPRRGAPRRSLRGWRGGSGGCPGSRGGRWWVWG